MLIAYSLMVKLVANQFLVFRVAALCNFHLLMLVGRFRVSLLLFSCEFDFGCVLRTLCSMRESSPRVLDQESPERPRRACSQAMLCTARVVAYFVGLWCLLHVLLWLVGCMFSS